MRRRNFVADAFSHCKFIGHSAAAKPLLDNAGVQADAGVVPLTGKKDVDTFLGALGALRLWTASRRSSCNRSRRQGAVGLRRRRHGDNPLAQILGEGVYVA